MAPYPAASLPTRGRGVGHRACRDRGRGAPGEKPVRDWGHGRAGDQEGVRQVKESWLGEVSWVYFPYGKREGGLGGGAGATQVKGGGRHGEAAFLSSALARPAQTLPRTHSWPSSWGQAGQRSSLPAPPEKEPPLTPTPRVVTSAFRICSLG